MKITRVVMGLLSGTVATSMFGCTALLPKRMAPAEGPLPEKFSLADAGRDPNSRWWQDFGSEELDGLVEESLRQNLTLRQLWTRLDQAGSTAVKAASGLYPELTLEGNASYRRTVTTVENESAQSLKSQLRDAAIKSVTNSITNAISQTNNGTTGTGDASQGSSSLNLGQISGSNSSDSRLTREIKSFGLSLGASYEIDIWGRIASEYRASQFDFDASRDDLESTAMTLAAEVTDRWLRIIEQQALRRVLEDQLKTNRTYLELVELRFRKSLVSALDVYQQRQTVSEVQQQIPLVEAQEKVLQHDLAVLLGKAPIIPLDLGTYDLSAVPPLPSAGLPLQLLSNRPDIRAALARLNAADYRVASARADRLPAIRLTGGIGYEADDISNIFDDWFTSLAGGLTAPLFDGFRRQAEEERTLAVVEERLADYRLTILTAIKEVENALVQERKQKEFIEAMANQLDDARSALREASQRYQKGLNDYLPVLAALERTQLLTRALISARRDLLIYRVDLYRAVGGKWSQEMEPPPRLSAAASQEALAKVVEP